MNTGSICHSSSFLNAALKLLNFTFVLKYLTIMSLNPTLCNRAAISSENGENHCGLGKDVSKE